MNIRTIDIIRQLAEEHGWEELVTVSGGYYGLRLTFGLLGPVDQQYGDIKVHQDGVIARRTFEIDRTIITCFDTADHGRFKKVNLYDPNSINVLTQFMNDVKHTSH